MCRNRIWNFKIISALWYMYLYWTKIDLIRFLHIEVSNFFGENCEMRIWINKKCIQNVTNGRIKCLCFSSVGTLIYSDLLYIILHKHHCERSKVTNNLKYLRSKRSLRKHAAHRQNVRMCIGMHIHTCWKCAQVDASFRVNDTCVTCG